ncbi:Holliday junction DNA helicase subunit RuvA [Halothece sp. PCC 7418]|uniref:Holliday junction branch migration protein RuvA n=1 Tax=Halothece sp. (strain PCC 7418) TaxID=65093 RepID=UPI0002A08AF6|nr:Holliday junction branch migration protein RuvA [Halothece sp. PCC 7418]AFZ42513.1 Holliday junction DNA helicase subunit RuvA [Halothece sp. PCC 7418]
MISYLRGNVINLVKITGNRVHLILEVNQVGYEIQIPSRLARELDQKNSESVQIFTHQQIRDDAIVLYGFDSAAERDLFRKLTAVSGIGTQVAIALIDTLGLRDLVEAIVAENTQLLAKTPGVGKKTAERIALELKSKLAQWRTEAGLVVTGEESVAPKPAIREDIEMTLLALGYSKEEIEQALSVISQDSLLAKNPNPEEWIRSAIAWLSR